MKIALILRPPGRILRSHRKIQIILRIAALELSPCTTRKSFHTPFLPDGNCSWVTSSLFSAGILLALPWAKDSVWAVRKDVEFFRRENTYRIISNVLSPPLRGR